jgi:hypothetical protein
MKRCAPADKTVNAMRAERHEGALNSKHTCVAIQHYAFKNASQRLATGATVEIAVRASYQPRRTARASFRFSSCVPSRPLFFVATPFSSHE